MRYVALLALFALVRTPAGWAQESLPAPVAHGLAALQEGHCEAAFQEWSASWTSAEDAAKRQQILTSCGLLNALGALNGQDIIRTIDVTPHVQRVYVMLLYEKQPVYLMLVAYRSRAEWKVMTVNWNTDYDKVVPATLLGAEHAHPGRPASITSVGDDRRRYRLTIT
jgi:hypothetical protein